MSTSSGIKNEIDWKQQLAKELQKPIIGKFEKGKVYSSFKNNIWGADLADMYLISNLENEMWNCRYWCSEWVSSGALRHEIS